MHRNTKTTATEWRDDDVNIEGVRELNRVYERIPFSREYEGVLDLPPLKLEWSTGANLPVAWKGGVAGNFGDTIVLAAGMWMPAVTERCLRVRHTDRCIHQTAALSG